VGNSNNLADLGMVASGRFPPFTEVRQRRTEWDELISNYASYFVYSPIWRHGTYVVIGVVLVAALLRQRTIYDDIIIFMLLSGFVFDISFFFISIVCDYRYLFFQDLTVLVALVYVACSWRRMVTARTVPRDDQLIGM
jgi:hypothetical protein